jgi:hypothetical protein
MPKETKFPQSATVFCQKPTKLTVKILRSILTSYGHKLKAQELRRDLLEQVVCMEGKVSEQDRRTISQLLEDKVEVTRAAITAVREYDGHAHVADDDDEEVEEEFRRDKHDGRHSQRWPTIGENIRAQLSASLSEGKEVKHPSSFMAQGESDESKASFATSTAAKSLPETS